jgi:hypothetical protein
MPEPNEADARGVPADQLTDASGRALARDDVEELAARNIIASGEAIKGVALDAYLECMSDETLLQWATDEKGKFPE